MYRIQPATFIGAFFSEGVDIIPRTEPEHRSWPGFAQRIETVRVPNLFAAVTMIANRSGNFKSRDRIELRRDPLNRVLLLNPPETDFPWW